MKTVKKLTSGITTKLIFQTDDKFTSAAAVVKRPDKTIICMSSQIGCKNACRFCSSRFVPFKRNLRKTEFYEVLYSVVKNVEIDTSIPLLISFMGTGEPLQNRINIEEFTREVKNARFAISTSGSDFADLNWLSEKVKVQLTMIHYSDTMRLELQPHVLPAVNLLTMLKAFKGKKEINIPLIAGFNDDNSTIGIIMQAAKTVTTKEFNPTSPITVKLNKFHGIHGFKASMKGPELAKKFGIEYYETDGEDINAACGQFELE